MPKTDKTAQKQAVGTYNTAQGIGQTAGQNSNDIYSKLFPKASQWATNPEGYGSSDLAAQNTASQESIGGSTAAAKGEGLLSAMRTGNRGAIAPAIADSIRSGQRQLSSNALAVQGRNADLKQQQQQTGLSLLDKLYGTNQNQELGSLGAEDSATNAHTKAEGTPWWETFLQNAQQGAVTGAKIAGVGATAA